MIALEIKSLKILMSQLLAGSTFDPFLLEKATITTSLTYTIDGRINRDFYTDQDTGSADMLYDFKPWSEIRELCFQLIKGKNTPLNFKFTLQLKPDFMDKLFQKKLPTADLTQLKALVLVIRFDGNGALITSGISYQGFFTDKEPERIWDTTLKKYLSEKGIQFEEN